MKLKSFNAFALMICFAIISATSVSGQATVHEDSLKTVTIKVSGITCSGDLVIINNNVMKQNGVISSVSTGKASATTTFEVKYDPAIVPIDTIYKIVESSPSCDYPDQKPYKVKSAKK